MIVVDPAKCTGCRRCEVFCAFFRTGGVGRARARIRVVSLEAMGVDFPVVCVHCRERFCAQCPEFALEFGGLGQVIVEPTLCTSCGTCRDECPIGAIELVGGVPYVCDLCGGRPQCVLECPSGAISYLPEKSGETSLERFRAGSTGLDPAAKRIRFARKSSGWTVESPERARKE